MTAPQQTTLRTTRMFARVLGPYMVIVAVVAGARVSDTQTLVSELDTAGVWQLVTGVLALLAGLVIIALHPYWRGGAATIVSAVGWLAVLEGLLLLALPQVFLTLSTRLVESVVSLWVVMVAVGLVGVYLTYIGWVGARLTEAPEPEPTEEPGARVE